MDFRMLRTGAQGWSRKVKFIPKGGCCKACCKRLKISIVSDSGKQTKGSTSPPLKFVMRHASCGANFTVFVRLASTAKGSW